MVLKLQGHRDYLLYEWSSITEYKKKINKRDGRNLICAQIPIFLKRLISMQKWVTLTTVGIFRNFSATQIFREINFDVYWGSLNWQNGHLENLGLPKLISRKICIAEKSTNNILELPHCALSPTIVERFHNPLDYT